MNKKPMTLGSLFDGSRDFRIGGVLTLVRNFLLKRNSHGGQKSLKHIVRLWEHQANQRHENRYSSGCKTLISKR